MKIIFKKVLILLSLFLFTQNLQASAENDLKEDFLKSFDSVIKVVKNKNLNKDDRNVKIVKLLTPMFDFTLMARLSLGKRVWLKMTEQEQKRFIPLYVERMKNSYSSKLDSYTNEKIEVKDIKRKKNRMVLKTILITEGKDISVVYKFYKPKEKQKDKNTWLIYDVEVDGASFLKADKTQFKELLQTKTISEFMDVLVEKQY